MPRRSMRIAASWPREHAVPLKQVMQEAMRAYAELQNAAEGGALMDRSQIESLLNEVREGRTGVADALDRLRDLPFEDMGFAKLDHHRALRTGMPEVIFAAGKTAGAGGRNLCAHGEGRRQRAGHARFARDVRGGSANDRSRAPNSTRRPAPSRSRRAPAVPRQGNHRAWSAPAPAICRWPKKPR